MELSNILFVAFALYVVNKVYWFVVYRQVERKTGAKFSPYQQKWSNLFGLHTLWSMMQLPTTLRTYEFLCEQVAANGQTMVNDVLWTRSMLTVDPENIKAILATQFDHFGKGPHFIGIWKEFLGNGIFNADGEVWKHSRAMLRPQFLKSRIADLEIMQNHAEIMTAQIQPGQVTDFAQLALRMSLDTATDFLFGESANTLEDHESEKGFAATFAKVQELQINRMMQGPFWRLTKFGDHIKDMNKYIDHYVQATLAKPIEKIDDEKASFLDVLAQDTRDPETLRDQLTSVLLAGRDTTAAILAWVIKHLSNEPEQYARLREEVLSTLGTDAAPTYHQLKNMPFLNACIDETLRLYPVVPINIRESLCDTTLPRGGGIDGNEPIAVRKGTTITYSPLVMHRRQDLPDVDRWLPDRWAKWTPKPWTYIPFNAGPRICVGQNFATVEISVVLTQIARAFARLENADDLSQDYAMLYNIILTPRNGTKVRFYTN